MFLILKRSKSYTRFTNDPTSTDLTSGRDVVRVWLRSGWTRNVRRRPPTAFAYSRFAGSCCVARCKCHDHRLGPFSTLSGEHTPDNGSDISSAVITVPPRSFHPGKRTVGFHKRFRSSPPPWWRQTSRDLACYKITKK